MPGARSFGVVLLLLLCSAATVGCDDDGPTGPTPQPFTMTGRWRGDVTVLNVPALMTWTLTQTGPSVSGPALVTLANGTVVMNANVAGTLAGTTFTYSMTADAGGIPAQPQCTGQLGGTATVLNTGSPATLSGTYVLVSSTCAAPFTNGSFLLRR
jgi:hypothetical protein